MKKLIATILILALLLPAAALSDDIDLYSMTYDELVALHNRLNIIMWASENWQEVAVPPGVWKIGEDIPAGHWSIRPAENCGPDYVIYASGTKDDGHDVDLFAGPYIMECICDPGAEYYTLEYKTSTDINMEDGHYVRLDCTMIFTPYSGKPDFGFK